MAINRSVSWLLAIVLQAMAGIGSAARPTLWTWDADPGWSSGIIVDLCDVGHGGACLNGSPGNAGSGGNSGTLQVLASPGDILEAKAQARDPSSGLTSIWVNARKTLPSAPSGFSSTIKRGGSAMTAPTFVAEYATAFNTTTSPKIAMNAVAINSGDVLVAVASTEDGAGTLSITENGAATATLQRSSSLASYSSAYGWTYVAPSNETITISFPVAESVVYFGGNVVRFSGSDGVGASNVATGASGNPSVTLTTTQANSAIVVICSDWNAVSGTQTFTNNFSGTPTALTNYPGDAAHYGVAIAYFPDAGEVGSKTVGMSAPTGMKWTIIAIEVKGSGAGATAVPVFMNQYAQRAK